MFTDDYRNRNRKIGCALGLCFALIGIYSLIRIVVSGASMELSSWMFMVGVLSVRLDVLLIFVVIVMLGGLAIYEDRELWKPWAALFGGPGVTMITKMLSLSEIGFVITTHIVSVVLSVFASTVFWRHLKRRG